MTRKFHPQEVEVSIHAEHEDIPVRGNAMVSGDPEYDKKIENELIDDLESGNIFAWCTAVVKARWAGFEGVDTLGAVSCFNEKGFRESVMEHGMIKSAVEDLVREIRDHGWSVDVPENTGDAVSNRFQEAEVVCP